MNINEEVDSQVIVCNIFWNKSQKGRSKKIELPDQLNLNIPDNVLNQAKKNENNFNDVIEQFVYNLMYRKYNCEVNECQIYLVGI